MQKGAIAYPFFKDEERTDWLIHSLKKMKKHWLSFYPYPVFIFHHAESPGMFSDFCEPSARKTVAAGEKVEREKASFARDQRVTQFYSRQ